MSEREHVRLSDFAPFLYGKSLPESSRFTGNCLVYGSNGVVGTHNEFLVQEPMVIIGRKGSIGEVHYAPHGGWPIDTTFYVKDSPERDIRFVYYLLKYLDMRHMSSDSAVPGLNRDAAHALEVAIPSLSKQRAIAEVLGALDDKIEANRRLAKLCDTRWQSALQIGDVTHSEPLSHLAEFINGRAFTKDASGAGRMVVRIAELNSGPSGSTVYNDILVPDVHLARPGDLLFSWSGSLTVRRWYRAEAIVNQHIFKVIPGPGIPIWLVHGAILQLMDFFRGIAADRATTMGHIQRRHLDQEVLLPSSERIADLDRWCRSLWQRALFAEQESLALASLRNALLPKLLSGELRVRDAEDVVSEAV